MESALELLGELDESELAMAAHTLESIEELQAMAAEAQARSEEDRADLANPVEIKPLKIQPPPKMGWALIGVPIIEFATVQALLARLPASAVIKTTANDGPEEERRPRFQGAGAQRSGKRNETAPQRERVEHENN